jgi:transposase
MDNTKYIAMDMHTETISIAVLNSAGKLVMESLIETKSLTVIQFMQGLRGDLHVTLEEGTWGAWLYDLLRPHVHQVLVCDPRQNAFLKVGNKSNKIDARKLAELLRSNLLRPVYHGEHGVRTLKELSRSQGWRSIRAVGFEKGCGARSPLRKRTCQLLGLGRH